MDLTTLITFTGDIVCELQSKIQHDLPAIIDKHAIPTDSLISIEIRPYTAPLRASRVHIPPEKVLGIKFMYTNDKREMFAGDREEKGWYTIMVSNTKKRKHQSV